MLMAEQSNLAYDLRLTADKVNTTMTDAEHAALNAVINILIDRCRKEAEKGKYSYSYSSWSNIRSNWRDLTNGQVDYISDLDINKFHALRIRLEQCGLKATCSHATDYMSSNRGRFSLTISWA